MKTQYQPDDLLTMQEAAEYLDVTIRWLRRLIRRYSIPVEARPTHQRLASPHIRFKHLQPLIDRRTTPGPKPKPNGL